MKTTITTNKTNTEITTTKTTRTTAIKEGKTMKNTKNIRTKIIAGALAAITTMTTLAVSASADTIQKYPGPTGIEIQIPVTPDEKKPDLFGASAYDDAKEETPSGEQKTTPYIPADEILNGSEPAIEKTKPAELGLPANDDAKEETPSGVQEKTPEISADEIPEGSEPAISETKPDLFGASANGDAKEETPSGVQEKTPEIPGDEIPEGSEPADATVTLPDGLFVSVPEEVIIDLNGADVIEKISEIPFENTVPVIEESDPVLLSAALSEDYTPSEDVFNHPIFNDSDLTDEEKAILEKIVKGMVMGGIDTFATKIPGCRIVGEPLKALVTDAMGGNSTTNALNRLAEDQKKYYEDLKTRVDNLDHNLSKYTKYIENKIVAEGEKNCLGQMFRNMSSGLIDLSSTVKGIMSNDKTSPEEKLVLLANANYGSGSTNYLEKVRDAVVKINTTIGNADATALDLNLYNTLMNLASANYMFSGEAHKDAMESATALTEQYVYANTLVLQCQNAAKALANLKPEQVEALKANPEIYAMYEKCIKAEEQSFQTDKQNETVTRLINCIAGFENFANKDKEGNRFINKGTNTGDIVLDFNVRTVDIPNSEDFRKACKNQYFNDTEMGQFLDYVRGTGLSVKDFLTKNNQKLNMSAKITDSIMGGSKHCYLVIDSKVTGSHTTKSSDFFEGTVYAYTQTIKVVDIYDPQCKVQNLTVTTYDRDCTHGCDTIENIKNHRNDFIFISAHKATNADNITKGNPSAPLEIQGPRINQGGLTINGPKVDKNGNVPQITVTTKR